MHRNLRSKSLLIAWHLFLFWLFLSMIITICLVLNFRPPVVIQTFLHILFMFSIILALHGVIKVVFRRPKSEITYKPTAGLKVSVGIPAYNDELSIGEAVRDFLSQPDVNDVVVVDNNSTDRTAEIASQAGARVVTEKIQGYGAACIRALKEASKTGDLIVLVEGDGTFSAKDIKKFLAFIENADMVLGTRTTRELNTPDSQMNWFMHYGNYFVAKLIQVLYWNTRLTDVGCTYRMIRKEALDKIIDQLTCLGSDFSCHMILVALKNNLKIIEIPVTLKKRIGISKVVGGNIIKGLRNGLKMWFMILFK